MAADQAAHEAASERRRPRPVTRAQVVMAAGLRAAGVPWARVAAEVGHPCAVVRHWPDRKPAWWQPAFDAAAEALEEQARDTADRLAREYLAAEGEALDALRRLSGGRLPEGHELTYVTGKDGTGCEQPTVPPLVMQKAADSILAAAAKRRPTQIEQRVEGDLEIQVLYGAAGIVAPARDEGEADEDAEREADGGDSADGSEGSRAEP